ncbi:hypothetical protein ACLGI4_28890 [Streptomyces sp. HMX112]|uniref:hypothetical protein n=1 Tax=Streptomyces sp. HMX112 TaxID=3390850 RepID=UPI003A7FE9AD
MLGIVVDAGVVGHPAGDTGELGNGGEQCPACLLRVCPGVCEVGDVLELSDDCEAGQGAAVLVVESSERGGGGLDAFDIGHAQAVSRCGGLWQRFAFWQVEPGLHGGHEFAAGHQAGAGGGAVIGHCIAPSRFEDGGYDCAR